MSSSVTWLKHWYLLHEHKMAFVTAKKCGSTTLHLATDSRVDHAEVPADYERIAVIRHPVARFWSLFDHIKRGYRFGKRQQELMDSRFDRFKVEPTQVWAYILRNPEEDVHWSPQHHVWAEEGQLDRLIKLESLDDWWLANVGGVLTHARAIRCAVIASTKNCSRTMPPI